MTERSVRIVDGEGAAPEKSGGRKVRPWIGELVPVATAAVIIASVAWFSVANPPWRPSGSMPIVDVYLKLDAQPETADEVLGLLSSHEAVLDQRILRQPPSLQGWISPSECDHRLIVRLLVPSIVDAKAVMGFAFDTYGETKLSLFVNGYGHLSSPVLTGCNTGTLRIPFKEHEWE